MTKRAELLRQALLHDQAGQLLRQDADRHESEAKRLREEAALLEESDNEHRYPSPAPEATAQPNLPT